MLIKICGIQTPEIARFAEQAGADFIGLVFAESKRQVDVEQAQTIVDALSEGVKVVGVFRHQSMKLVNRITKEVGLDYVQLHGEETVEDCLQVDSPVIKAFSFEERKKAIQYEKVANYVLLDSPKPGSGETFDWHKVANEENVPPFFLAGGLHPENVKEAIHHIQPLGVDVSSGVETNGQKDKEKIQQFIQEAKAK